jgi:alpha-D-ribose 1-methylphosphonate 5-triphosphate synthase subunit PhnH
MFDLSTMSPGFSELGSKSQEIFRAALHALSHPGELVCISPDLQVPAGHSGAAGLLLALLDADCTMWMSKSLMNSQLPSWLRFHTGCCIVEDKQLASFAWISDVDHLGPLNAFRQASDDNPEVAATLLIEVSGLSTAPTDKASESCRWTLRGPGINGFKQLNVSGLEPEFIHDWARNGDNHFRGVDVFLVAQNSIIGLPRSTQIHAQIIGEKGSA